jgi:hypothetical protein
MKGKPRRGSEMPEIPFEAWVSFAFDHPVPDSEEPAWYFVDDEASTWWIPSRQAAMTISFLTKLFEHASSVLAPFSDAQIKEGLWFLADNVCSEHMYALLNPRVPWPDRKRCISSMYTLFEQFFASRCSSHLSHLDTTDTDTSTVSPLNMACYMWWDLLPISAKPQEPDRAELDALCLKVMAMALDLDSDACRESALHGLGHWQFGYPKHVEAIIDRFLDRQRDLQPELRAYAHAARKGRVQ